MKTYEVISSSNLDAFNMRLRRYVEDGWEPCGQLVVTPTEHDPRYSLLLVKEQ